jgi:hypothetical protein
LLTFYRTSMQLNVGIIAANIPTMRPLLRKPLRTTSEERYNRFNDVEHIPTIGSDPKTPRSRKGFFTAIYADVDEQKYEMANARNRERLAASSRTQESPIYIAEEDRIGSEERILSHNAEHPKGIKRTTEVVVNNVKKGDPT